LFVGIEPTGTLPKPLTTGKFFIGVILSLEQILIFLFLFCRSEPDSLLYFGLNYERFSLPSWSWISAWTFKSKENFTFLFVFEILLRLSASFLLRMP